MYFYLCKVQILAKLNSIMDVLLGGKTKEKLQGVDYHKVRIVITFGREWAYHEERHIVGRASEDANSVLFVDLDANCIDIYLMLFVKLYICFMHVCVCVCVIFHHGRIKRNLL